MFLAPHKRSGKVIGGRLYLEGGLLLIFLLKLRHDDGEESESTHKKKTARGTETTDACIEKKDPLTGHTRDPRRPPVRRGTTVVTQIGTRNFLRL